MKESATLTTGLIKKEIQMTVKVTIKIDIRIGM
jgi:hypothetical protein